MKDYFNKSILPLKDKKLWLFDMDGTVYLGNNVITGSISLIENLHMYNKIYIFNTNNSSKGIDDYLKKLLKLGIRASKDNFYTSVDASASLLKEKFNNQLIYAQGTNSFIDNLKNEGLNITTDYNKNAKCIIVGYDTELTYQKLIKTSKMLLLDIPYYATNPDWVCPTEFGYVPDCGSMCFALEKATGKSPIYIGKPSPYMIEKIIKKYKVDRKDVVIIGDRIYTDIASGFNAGIDTILVLSGESTLKTLSDSNIKPSFVLKDVNEINCIFNN